MDNFSSFTRRGKEFYNGRGRARGRGIGRGNDQHELTDVQRQRIAILYDTLDACKTGIYGSNYLPIQVPSSTIEIRKKDWKQFLEKENTKYDDFNISVVNADSFTACIDTINAGYKKVALLNMASAHTPGGGVRKGSMAQEEELCRRSNLLTVLEEHRNQCKGVYKIPNTGTLYNENITILKDTDYNYLTKPYQINVISSAALKRPDLIDDLLSEYDAEITKDKIRAILATAMFYNNEVVILSAFGCGAYGNPPNHMAQLFDEVICEPEYYGSFKEIIFAILEDTNSMKHGGNLSAFQHIFTK